MQNRYFTIMHLRLFIKCAHVGSQKYRNDHIYSDIEPIILCQVNLIHCILRYILNPLIASIKT